MALLPSSSCSSYSSSKGEKYDVFLSFRDEDTRKRFADHLYIALKQKGISTFKDDEKLKQGTPIAPELLKAIEESRFAVIILSRDYASSKWCLNELTKIIERMEKTGLVVLPVFHYVDPSDVRNHKGTFAEAFDRHEESFKDNMGNVETWKAALTKVANLSGWDLKDEYESKVIQEIIGRICTELYHKFSSVCEELVGIDSCVEEMLGSYLNEGLGGVRFVGICGMGGMGKTTLAQEIYRRISGNFQASSFIANIREETKNKGLVSLQKQLLSKILMESEINIWNVCEGIDVIRKRLYNKKIFIVLDDVDREEQLGALAGKHEWFGLGSRIIVTSRDSHLLIRCGVDDIYKAKGLSDNDALKLFSLKAFHKPHPEENFVNLSMVFVNYAKGLPLALKVLGSLLFDKTKNEWKSALNKLKAEFDENIMNIFQISFDGLMDTQKALFLDIACFFKGENKDCIRDVLQSFGYYPDYNIGVLIDKSLITIEDHGILWMHDLLQVMGQEIVCHGSPREPGGRSRLWIYKDVIHVLKNNIGTEAVEGIMLKVPIQKMEHLNIEAFSKMKNLRFLKIGDEKFPQDFINGTMQLPKSLNYLSNELRIIEWHGYPFKSMPTSFQPNKLVELRMRCSSIKQLWKGIMNLDELRLIDLSDSQKLIEMPDLSGAPKLKQLILQRCIRLSKIHASLGNLKCLIRLDLNGCRCLKSLPHKISLEALEILDLVGCSRLKKFPQIVGIMPHLSQLCLNETAIKELPLSMEHLTGLIEDEKSEKQIVSEPNGMEFDEEAVKMTDSSEQKEFVIEEIGSEASQTRQPEDIHVEKMQPQALSTLKPQGVVIDVGAVKILKSSGQTESQIEDVEMETKASEQCGLFLMQGGLGLTFPPKDEDWKNAKEIYLMDNELSALPKNPRCPNLSALFIPRNYKLRMIPPSFFDYMPALQILNLSRTSIKSLPDSVIRLVSLKRMFLNDCHRLMMLSPKVGDLKQLEILDLEGAKIVELPMEIKALTNLKCLEVSFYGYMSNGRRAMQSSAVVPCGIISAFSQLEELNIDVNPDDERWDACVEDIVTEVCTLMRLETLKFYFPRVELLRHFQRYWPLLSHFRFTVGRHVKRIMSRVPPDVEFELERWERCLKYINGEGVPGDIKNVLHHVTAFFLDRHATVKKLSDFGTRNMKKLKCCVVGECNEVQVIIDAADAFGEDGTSEIVSESYDVERIVLGSLEYLYIYYMKSLRCIWDGSVQQNSLFLLKSLTLRTCPLLTTIFTQGLLDNLCNLEELKVEDCPSIKSIVSCGNSSELRTSYFLPNLKKILLHYMPGLVSISSGLHIAPQLEFLSLYNCPNLKNPLIDEVSCQDLKKIKGERSWWEALEWSNGRPCYLEEIFVPTDI